MSAGEPIIDPLCTNIPDILMNRPCYAQDGITNTFRLMHDPPDPDYARWYDTSGKYRRPVEPGPRVTEGNEVMYLVRGEETYEQMVAAIRSTHGNLGTKLGFIYLLGWDLNPQSLDMEMVPGDKTSSMRELLKAAHSTGTEIRAMLWANAKPFETPSTKVAVDYIRSLNSPTGNAFAICDDNTRIGKWGHLARLVRVGAHHQKVLIVNGTYGLMAFCGGIDIDSTRLDHVKDETYLGWEDVHCRVRGPGAHFLLWIFRQRWRNHAEGKSVKLWGDDPSIDAKKNDPVDNCYVQIGRTFPAGQFPTSIFPPQFPGYSFAPNGEQTVKQMVLKAIAAAKTHIYMEDQYLFCMEISNALKDFISKDSARFLLILISNDGGVDGEVYGTEKPHRAEFINNLKNAPGGEKVLVFEGPQRYVHSKIYLFDDKMAIIGSANCNRRGMEHDSEVTAGIYDDPEHLEPAYHFCHRLRMRLWADNLNLANAKTYPNRTTNTDEDYAEVADPLGAIAHYLKEWPGRRIIPYVPDPNLGGGWNNRPQALKTAHYTPQEVFDQMIDPGAALS